MAVCVEVFGVYEEAVHVEETGSDWREAGVLLDCVKLEKESLLCFRGCHFN